MMRVSSAYCKTGNSEVYCNGVGLSIINDNLEKVCCDGKEKG
jgi:hypothetical protein